MEKETSSKLAVNLLKKSKKQILDYFHQESADQNNNTRYDELRKLKSEIRKNETANMTDDEFIQKEPSPLEEPYMTYEDRLIREEEGLQV